MASVVATVDDKALLALISRTTGSTALSRIAKTLDAAANEIAEVARDEFPVSRSSSGKIKDKSHARDSIRVVSRLTPTQITFSVVSDVKYIYFIRSYQIKESLSSQEDRFKRRKGESDEDYASRRTIGRKRHAWNTLVAKPGKRTIKQIAAELEDDLLKLSQGR